MNHFTRGGGTIPLPSKAVKARNRVETHVFRQLWPFDASITSAYSFVRILEHLASVLPKEGRHSHYNSLTRAQSIDSLASPNMTNLSHDPDCHRALMRPLRPGHAVLPMALLLGMWFSFSPTTIKVVHAATPSEPATADPSTLLVEENAAATGDHHAPHSND